MPLGADRLSDTEQDEPGKLQEAWRPPTMTQALHPTRRQTVSKQPDLKAASPKQHDRNRNRNGQTDRQQALTGACEVGVERPRSADQTNGYGDDHKCGEDLVPHQH